MVDRYAGRCSYKGGAQSMRREAGCGCDGGSRGECKKLEKKLKQIDFSIIDVTIYLDAYPNCRKALDYYHKLKCERAAVVEALNSTCGPITSFDNNSESQWKWTDAPWPWEAEAN